MASNELVGIQGLEGSNHEIAAKQLYGQDVPLAYIQTFPELFTALKSREIGRAVVAFSNTTTDDGWIPAPWKEMKTHGTEYWLTDKTEVLVRHRLLGVPGTTLDKITSVHSMDVAFEQCDETLARLLPNADRVYEKDTALSAKAIMLEGDPSKAAVAPPQAEELYGLTSLTEWDIQTKGDIQDDPYNTTSFFSWSLREDGLARMTGNEDKTLMFVRSQNPNIAGVLEQISKALSDQSINLADFHSVSIPAQGSRVRGKQFFIEADAGFQTDPLQKALRTLGRVGFVTNVLGSWVDTIDGPLALDQSTV